MARQLAVWFDRSFANVKQTYGPFVPPPNPVAVTAALAADLVRLRREAVAWQEEAQQHKLTAEAEAHARKKADEDAKRVFDDLRVALELATESEAKFDAERKAFEKQLAEVKEL